MNDQALTEPSIANWDIESAHSGALLTLAKLMKVSGKFQLCVLEYNDHAYRQRLIKHIDHFSHQPFHWQIDNDLPSDQFLEQLYQHAERYNVIHFLNLESWFADSTGIEQLHRLNYQRETIAHRCKLPLILWLTADHIKLFAREAPDLWAWRCTVLNFSVDRKIIGLELNPPIDLGNSPLPEHRQRIKEIDDYLQQHQKNTFSTAALRIELGQIYEQIGQTDSALHAFEDAFKNYKVLRNFRDAAISKGYIARIKLDKGEIDEALQLHQEMIGVFETLNDQRERAVTLGDIARIKFKEGDVNESLHLHQEIMETFKALNGQRDQAITLGDIANIKAHLGDIEEALRLHQEAVEIYQTIGDQRARSASLGSIARINVDKGDIDEALQIYQKILTIFETLGDQHSCAVTLYDIGKIFLIKKNWGKAMKCLSDAYPVMLEQSNLQGIAHVGLLLGQLLCKSGYIEQGHKILERSKSSFERLQQPKQAQRVANLIDQLTAATLN